MWQGGVRAREDASQLLPLWEELQVQGGSGVSPEIRALSRKSNCVITCSIPSDRTTLDQVFSFYYPPITFDPQTPENSEEAEALKAQQEADPERTASGRVQRASAQVANFQMAEIANNDLPKDWPKRKFQSDLVPDDQKAREGKNGSKRGVNSLVCSLLSSTQSLFNDGVFSS